MPLADRADPERGAPPDVPDSGAARPHAESGGELMLVQPAVPASLRPMRRSARRWLDEAGWPVIAAEDIELAVNEAVANVIDHACLDHDPGPIHLHAWISPPVATASTHPGAVAGVVAVIAAPGFPTVAIPVSGPPLGYSAGSADGFQPLSGRVATVVVSDRGRWSPERRSVDPGGHRAHGLGVMTGLMAAVHLQRSAGGTTVVLVSHPVRQ
jgi:anti-sigma regulatory factor (Ser/Thr protein kinase)